MPTRTGTAAAEVIDLRNETAAPPAGWPTTQQWWIVDALGGNDTVYGSAYGDSVNGGDGTDYLYGFNGNDALSGGNDTDYLYGGNGDDYLSGGAGSDYLYGEAGNDWIQGDDGNDYMVGADGNDTFVGGNGVDTMFGQNGDDVFFGDAGNDIMDGGAGNDRLWGNTGNDQYQFNGQGIDYINDGVTNTGQERTETTYDTSDRLIVSYTSSDVIYFYDGNDLVITSATDYNADNIINNAVVIEDFLLGGHHTVELLQTADNMVFDLTSLLAA